MSERKKHKGQGRPKKTNLQKNQRKPTNPSEPSRQMEQTDYFSHADYNMVSKALETYEITRENTLITQAGLQTAIFSFLTSAVFTAWRMGIEYFTRIPKRWIHFLVGVVTFCLVLSLLGSVLALFFVSNTRKKEITYEAIKKCNNRRVTLLKGSLFFFLISILIIIFASWILGGMYYHPMTELF